MKKEVIATKEAPAAVGPYSQAIRSGNTLYVSGQVPINPETGKMPETIEEQARQCLNNIAAILKAAGLGMENVVRCGIFMTNLDDFKTVNEIYASFFSGDYPARATVQVARLPLGAMIEIDAIAEA
ncbi:MAG: reactive intermediate/imine deaminase [Deltaproteobacteria bacterium]|nr:MAG: reactive intermediate/imine deaminase [Deltaproteobacteria bacterium]